MSSRGFTLLELLVTISIVLILAALAIPAYAAISARGHSTKCLSNLRQLGVALTSYLGDHDQQMPTLLAGRRSTDDEGPVLDEMLSPYTNNPSVFHCPADASLWKSSGTSYYWNVALNGQRATSLNFLNLVDDMSRIPVLSDKEGWHRYRDDKVNFLYADGHATKELQLFTQD